MSGKAKALWFSNRDPDYFCLPEEIISRDQKIKNISSGAGQHLCPGGKLTGKATARLIRLFSEPEKKVKIVHVEDKWADSFGSRFPERLRAEVVTTENIK